ncbi:glucoside xylosyltransferase 1-like [Hyalella azteca]|uniref:Glucoside xylosyltransferase 1-like n=1 Tax=Hyalella azteca TaxID=294128 RepID=A0A979FJY5_HYAAZ|nr:glucoside xylosyltransferase 1-like [Hyalella azteca]
MFHHRGSVIRIPISNLCYVLAICGTIYVFLQIYLDLIQRESAGYSVHLRINRKEVVAVMVLCEGTPDNSTSFLMDISRQFFQAHVAMKSFIYLSNQPVKFIIVSDSQTVFKKIEAFSEAWPYEQKSKLTLQFVSDFYPDEFKELKKLFRPCATQKLFADQILPEEDAVIYIDTDVIFMRSPVQLWDEFKRFDDKQMMAAATPTWMSVKRKDDAPQVLL